MFFFFFNDTATTEIYTLSLHDALPILTKAGFDEARKGRKKIRMETDGLARAVKAGFDGVDKSFDGVDKRFDGVDKRFDGVDKRLNGIDKRLSRVESTMVNKDYLDEKLADLRGDIVILLRKEDRKLEALIEKLKKKHIITDKDIKELQEIQIFAQWPFSKEDGLYIKGGYYKPYFSSNKLNLGRYTQKWH